FEWNTPGLVLIFSSIPRCLFRFILPYLITLFKQSHEAQSPSCLFIKTVKQRQIWKTLLAQFDSMPFQLAHFQNLLNEVDTAVRSAYAAAGILAEPQRHAVEKAMLIDGTIPAVLAPAVQRLLQPDVFLDALVRESSFSALDILFYDTAWLGLHDEPSHTKKRMFDVLKKTPLPEGTMARKCTRCGSLMEELPSPPQGSTQAQPTLVEPPRIPNWIVANQRTCICGNHWVLAKWEARRGR
ncbi:Mediator of RNA polymerase II transcription subunit 16, partial [Cryomyces antarcticus]